LPVAPVAPKLAAGMQARIGADLSVIANTGDDIETLGCTSRPTPDLITYWLSGDIDEERGGESGRQRGRLPATCAARCTGLVHAHRPRPRACLYRHHFLAEGGRLTAAQEQDRPRRRGQGVGASHVRAAGPTRVQTPAGWSDVQEFLILDRSQPQIEDVQIGRDLLRQTDNQSPTRSPPPS